MAVSIKDKFPDTVAVYVFGSVAEGKARQGSDVDMAVLAQHALPVMDVWLLAQELVTVAGVDVDLTDLRSASAVMRMEVIGKGNRLICMDDDACAVFEDFVFSDYARLNEERVEILNDIHMRGTIYG